MNSQRLIYQSLKYQRLAPIFCKVIGIRKFEFVAKTQLVSGVTISILLTDVMFVLKA